MNRELSKGSKEDKKKFRFTLQNRGDITISELKEILAKRPKEPTVEMRHLKILFNTFFVDRKGEDEASLDKIAQMLKTMGLANITPDEYPILLETMDKNKDGRIWFNDFISQIPTFDSDKVFSERDEEHSPVRRESLRLKSLGKKSKFPGIQIGSTKLHETKRHQKFKYDKNDKSDVIILDDNEYEKIIEDFKEKMSM